MNESEFYELLQDLGGLMTAVQEMNQDAKYRDRKLSLAVTNIEQGLLWLEQYNREREWSDE